MRQGLRPAILLLSARFGMRLGAARTPENRRIEDATATPRTHLSVEIKEFPHRVPHRRTSPLESECAAQLRHRLQGLSKYRLRKRGQLVSGTSRAALQLLTCRFAADTALPRHRPVRLQSRAHGRSADASFKVIRSRPMEGQVLLPTRERASYHDLLLARAG